MESSAFVSFSCWTLTATASAALQAGPLFACPLLDDRWLDVARKIKPPDLVYFAMFGRYS